MSSDKGFKLTYATMFNPPEELHTRYDEGLRIAKNNLGKDHAMIIDGKDRFAEEKFINVSPINTDILLGTFQKGTVKDANDAIEAAAKAFPLWSHTPWQERVKLVRKAAELMEERIFQISPILSLEGGKNRLESLGDIAEAVDLFKYACDQMEANDGFIVQMGKDPLIGYTAENTSVLVPYGVWLVISPFNIPGALTSGPTAVALVTGNTLVIKPSSDTPWAPKLIAECVRDAGIPDGVCNFITGPGSTVGQTLVESEKLSGVTFTGSHDVGMGIYRIFAQGQWVRPVILELGGKNPAIVSNNANIEEAALGIVRSAFGLQGQKCSACSRVFAEGKIYDALVNKLVEFTNKLTIGDPTDRSIYLGPVINKNAYADYKTYVNHLNNDGNVLTGGKVLTDGDLSKGYFCAPTLVVDLPLEHKLWKHEMFVPITTITKVKDLNEAFNLSNDVAYGLTAGFYGNEEEAKLFFDKVEAGVLYANRSQGATSGAWPGYQPFGGWKGSGATGKNVGGVYYLHSYMHEKSQTLIRKN